MCYKARSQVRGWGRIGGEGGLEPYCKLEPTVLTGNTADALHVLYHEVSTDMFNLLPLVAGADGDHSCTACEPGPDPARGVLEDDAVRRGEPQLTCCEEEWIGCRLSRLQAFVICGDRHLGRYDADARHASERCRDKQSDRRSFGQI